MLRSKGFFCWAAVPRENWPEIEGLDAELEKKWHPEVGDCPQELVFIGINMDEPSITKSLEACLLTDEEFAMGIEAWTQYDDPFPAWNMSVNEALVAQQELDRAVEQSSDNTSAYRTEVG